MKRYLILALGFSLSLNFLPRLWADEIGYWRFEPGALATDSGKLGLHLRTAGESKPIEFALPGQYEGARFPTTIPQTQAKNAGAAQFDGRACFYLPDQPAFKIVDALTVEAIIKADESGSATHFIVSQFSKGDGERAWFLAIQGGQLRFSASADGTTPVAQNSYFSQDLNKRDDYYVAAVYSAGTVTFYLKNLTENSPLESSIVDGFPKTIFDAPSQFRIGAFGLSGGTTGSGGSGNFFLGLIDEVRLSSAALAPKDLLINASDVNFVGTPAK